MQASINTEAIKVFKAWQADWCKFAKDVLKVNLDPEQQEILRAVQTSRRVSVCSGTARGKDFIAAVACVCFMYLTPKFDGDELIENTKIAMTAPTDRQVGNIMFPEVSRLVNRAKVLPGRLVGYDIRTDWEEWFLTGFKASKDNHEAWSGFHAANTMFVVTEASGIDQSIFDAIEGNLQGNSRLLIVFNPNIPVGYAAKSQKQARWKRFRLDSLSSPNVIQKKIVIPGQVDYEWVKDKVDTWCTPISAANFTEAEGDFQFESVFYRPNDLFRIKVRGMFPKVSEDTLIPLSWIELAQENWKKAEKKPPNFPVRIGVDVAGMGRDNSIFCYRLGNYVEKFERVGTAGTADHMAVAGHLANVLRYSEYKAFIDTIGEGAGVYSRLIELGHNNAFSAKFSEGADELTDYTGVYRFFNMRAYCYWAVRDWLNPANNQNPCLPPCDEVTEELTEIKWSFKSNGTIIVEPKEDIKKRLKRSPDYSDSLAETFYPHDSIPMSNQDLGSFFH